MAHSTVPVATKPEVWYRKLVAPMLGSFVQTPTQTEDPHLGDDSATLNPLPMSHPCAG
jgi:hypothetical protein